MTKQSFVFYPQLDSLRAIAVLLVIISHWFSADHFLNRYTANGIMGVTLFFVLSGYLITSILLKNKAGVEAGSSLRKAFKIFYIRRSLRIFPIYYLLLLIALVLGLSNVRESFWWHFFYGSNFYFWVKGGFLGHLSHFWSLAVEEQFYLVWPAIILLTPRRHLIYTLLVGILVAVLFRYFIITDTSQMGRFLMPSSLDSFCIGGILVYGRLSERVWYAHFIKRKRLFVSLAFFLLLAVHLDFFSQLSRAAWMALYLLLISVAFGIIINRVACYVDTPVLKQFLDNPVLLYLGKISYGLYLFHNFVPYLYGLKLPIFLQPYSMYIAQGLRLFLLILIASVSWYLWEKPFLRFKERFSV
jgi:peptidoglycan/LPS O-acetylase OafA/YrhL